MIVLIVDDLVVRRAEQGWFGFRALYIPRTHDRFPRAVIRWFQSLCNGGGGGEYYKMAPNWNVSGTRDFNLLSEIQLRRLTFVSESPTTRSAIGKFAAD